MRAASPARRGASLARRPGAVRRRASRREPAAQAALRYVFPDHWSFLLGEIALYASWCWSRRRLPDALLRPEHRARPSTTGRTRRCAGTTVSHAFGSTVRSLFDVPAGLLVRQTHHWAALVFVAAIVVHLMRVFFTGAFRKPRDVNWMIGVTMLVLAILEGFAGYSLPDDLLSGMGLAIAYGGRAVAAVIGGAASRSCSGAASSRAARLRAAAVHRCTCCILPAILGAPDRGAPGDRSCARSTRSSRARGARRRTSSARRCGPATRCARSGLLFAVRGGARAARRPRADQPGLAVGAVRAVALPPTAPSPTGTAIRRRAGYISPWPKGGFEQIVLASSNVPARTRCAAGATKARPT